MLGAFRTAGNAEAEDDTSAAATTLPKLEVPRPPAVAGRLAKDAVGARPASAAHPIVEAHSAVRPVVVRKQTEPLAVEETGSGRRGKKDPQRSEHAAA